MSTFSFKTLAEDLLTLEVNTIVKADMAACKMPALRREALWQIAAEYHIVLLEYGCRDPIIWNTAGIMSFRELRDRARTGIDRYEEYLKTPSSQPLDKLTLHERLIMLTRIQVQSEQLISMYVELACPTEQERRQFNYREACDSIAKRHQTLLDDIADYNLQDLTTRGYRPMISDEPSAAWNNDLNRQAMQNAADLALNAAQMGLVRKIWEIGVERIVMQTVIHADGDITTRMSERFTQEFNATILQIHDQSVNSAVGFWVSLVRTIGEMAGNLLGGNLLRK